jgi:iron complex outermembrane receptor protein
LQNDILPFASRLVLAPRLLVTTGERSGSALARADASLDLIHVSNRFADAAGLIVIPQQSTLGLSAAVTWLSGALVTRARLANAFDADRFDIVGYPLPGRSLYVSAEVHAP